jgi:peptide deformylase
VTEVLMDDHPLLRTVSEPVTDFEAVKHTITRMVEVLMQKGGRGLAAVQIGEPLRVIIVRVNKNPFKGRIYINPLVTRVLNRHAVEHEGCLSVPAFKWGDVSRPAKCDVTWLGIDGQENSATLTGEEARIFQHEFDHLEGVLITDRIARRPTLPKLALVP